MYMTYTDYNQLMTFAENLLSSLVYMLYGTHQIECRKFNTGDTLIVDFTAPFKRYDFVKEIENATGYILPKDLSTHEAQKILLEICDLFSVECAHPKTNARLLDKLAGHFIEPKCVNPSFIINHPLVMSPLAKWHRDDKHITERFELFITGYEFMNAYTELNDPFVQRETFEEQMKAKNSGDAEACEIDESFVNALEYGMPATGGLGIGIDRLVMLLTKSTKIQDVILFPMMRPEISDM